MGMPNIGTVLREEITRLSRRESRSQIDATRKATAQHRRDIAALKRQVADLERQVTLLARKGLATQRAAVDAPAKPVRFVAKGLRSQRMRLGLSAADLGKLLDVSAQSIYNWERELARPRGEQLARLAALRGIGKREAGQRLKQLLGSNGKAPRKS
jgi:ribosome-binding protein aMBF1 (putative translation factor)